MTQQVSTPAPTQVMREFVRGCGHRQRMLHTVGDAEQAARYESTGCSVCRTPAITFAGGWAYGGGR